MGERLLLSADHYADNPATVDRPSVPVIQTFRAPTPPDRLDTMARRSVERLLTVIQTVIQGHPTPTLGKLVSQPSARRCREHTGWSG
jgi:hypothetical protein